MKGMFSMGNGVEQYCIERLKHFHDLINKLIDMFEGKHQIRLVECTPGQARLMMKQIINELSYEYMTLKDHVGYPDCPSLVSSTLYPAIRDAMVSIREEWDSKPVDTWFDQLYCARTDIDLHLYSLCKIPENISEYNVVTE